MIATGVWAAILVRPMTSYVGAPRVERNLEPKLQMPLIRSATNLSQLPSMRVNCSLPLFLVALATGSTCSSQVLLVEHAAVGNGGFPAANAGAFHSNSSHGRALSRNARWLVFSTGASNLASGGGGNQIYILDRATQTTSLVSVSSAGTSGNGTSLNPTVSSDGRFVAFYSVSTNLVENDRNNVADIFVRDRVSATTVRASVGPNGIEASVDSTFPTISGDGRMVAFASTAPEFAPALSGGHQQIYVRDLAAGTTELVSRSATGLPGVGSSREPALSADGRYIAFQSGANNLVAHPTHSLADIFVLDRQTSTMEHVAIRSDGTTSNAPSILPSISDDGRVVGFNAYGALDPNDQNSQLDGYVHDRATRITQRATLGQGLSELPIGAAYAVVSGDGQWVAFMANANNVVPGVVAGIPHVYIRHLTDGLIRQVSINRNGTAVNDQNVYPTLGKDGSVVGFYSRATNWIPDSGASTTLDSVYLVMPAIDDIHADAFD